MPVRAGSCPFVDHIAPLVCGVGFHGDEGRDASMLSRVLGITVCAYGLSAEGLKEGAPKSCGLLHS